MNAVSPPYAALMATWVLFVLFPSPAAGQQVPGFGERPRFTLAARDFTDGEVTAIIATLERLLAAEKDPARWGDNARTHLWNFARQLQTARLTPTQELQVSKHLDGLARLHPTDASLIARTKRMIGTLTLGKTAPDIVGKDLNGIDFRLSDYRGKVVVLLFSADWCGICRTLNPYERLMLELYQNWPFAILSVETGASPELTKQAKVEEGLAYRSWWDVSPEGGSGPIASSWNVGGFPSIYVIDESGVIRFVDLRYEDLLKGVRQLLTEEATPVVRKQTTLY
jgi:peroxiredoxin